LGKPAVGNQTDIFQTNWGTQDKNGAIWGCLSHVIRKFGVSIFGNFAATQSDRGGQWGRAVCSWERDNTAAAAATDRTSSMRQPLQQRCPQSPSFTG